MKSAPVFSPEEVLFSLTERCNLACGHCGSRRGAQALSVRAASKFLVSCRRYGIEAVGFTGGEPFLVQDILQALTRLAVNRGMVFDRLMTNGVWWRSEEELTGALIGLFNAGFDGTICVSVDALHGQDVRKVGRFIEIAALVWRRPDIVSLASVKGARDAGTQKMLKRLASHVGGRLAGFGTGHAHIQGKSVFIKVLTIALSSVGKASSLKDPWNGAWFREDYCRGPGNVFYVAPGGEVKPCCGYANEAEELTIGNINRDSALSIMKRFAKNRFADTVFRAGLGTVRRRLEKAGIVFPGKTSDQCYLCDYILRKTPRRLLERSLMKKCIAAIAVLATVALFASSSEAQTLCKAKGYRQIRSRVVKRIAVPTWYHEGLYYDGKSLWLANGLKGKTWIIDPVGGSISSELEPVAGFAEAITKAGDAYYTTEWDEKKLFKIRVENGKMVAEGDVSFAPAHPAGLLWNGSNFFVVTWTRGLGTKFDLLSLDENMRVLTKVRIRHIHEPCQLAWDGRYLWISSWYAKAVYKVDVTTWEILGYFSSPAEKTTGIAWDGRSFWVTGTYADLYQIEIEDEGPEKEAGR